MDEVENIPLTISDEWEVTMERVIAFIIIKFFKEHPGALVTFMKKYLPLDKDYVLSCLQTVQKKSKQNSTHTAKDIGTVLEKEQSVAKEQSTAEEQSR
jgi:hypothetical protein